MTLPSDLLNGYRRFRQSGFGDQAALYRGLAREGQAPSTLVISCCDSRIDPALVFDAGPGDLFVLRNVANLVPPADIGPDSPGTAALAALEYGVTVLEVGHVLILGHSGCGGVKAARARAVGNGPGGYVEAWIALLDPIGAALGGRPEDDDEALQTWFEREGVRLSIKRLKAFDFVAERLAAGRLTLHGGHFDIATGRLAVLKEEDGEFYPLSADQ